MSFHLYCTSIGLSTLGKKSWFMNENKQQTNCTPTDRWSIWFAQDVFRLPLGDLREKVSRQCCGQRVSLINKVKLGLLPGNS